MPEPINRSQSILAGILAVGILAALAVPEVLSQPLLSGEARVVDGDSIEILPRQYGEKPTRVRLLGVAAPELRQACGVIHCGLAARYALIDAIRGALVTCKPSYVRHGDRYRDAEEAARAGRLGLWRTGNFGDPEEWRRDARDKAR
jgi:endonuclease YncB( thermonuclease family)